MDAGVLGRRRLISERIRADPESFGVLHQRCVVVPSVLSASTANVMVPAGVSLERIAGVDGILRTHVRLFLPRMTYVLGVDLDNTLLSYDELMARLALERGWLVDPSPAGKTAIRDRLRLEADGERRWMELQALAYGRHISEALPAPGAKEFLRTCRDRGVPVYVVSHKTRFAAADPGGLDLRDAALRLMHEHGLFDKGSGVTPGGVYFEGTRAEKIERIRQLGCSHFVDDLEETFLDMTFPTEVERLLYAPDGRAPRDPRVRAFSSWSEIIEHLFPAEEMAALASRLGRVLFTRVGSLRTLHGGRNNRIYRFEAGGGSYVAKVYFAHRGDPRDRLGVEFEALRFLRAHGVTSVPEPVASEPASRLAIYRFVSGAAVTSVEERDVDDAVCFLQRLRELTGSPGSRSLPAASEACFSVEAAIRSVEGRLARLTSVPPGDAVEREFREFLAAVRPALDAVARRARERAAPDRELPRGERTLSPSDFGFHNALRPPEGGLVFLDFEYFGWDDPAKTISDFLLHPAMSLDARLKQRFVAGALDALGRGGGLPQRLEALYPVYGLKWCLLLLNEFVPEDRERRHFAVAGSGDPGAARPLQLERARALLVRVMSECESFPYAA